jgi:uncharacterized protein YneF (UPF0154 family)
MEKNVPERWHGAHHYSDKIHIFLVIFLFLTVGSLLYFYFSVKGMNIESKNVPTLMPTQSQEITEAPTKTPNPSLGSSSLTPKADVFCTMDAMQCPDGSWVGRSGPNCEFKCPAR